MESLSYTSFFLIAYAGATVLVFLGGWEAASRLYRGLQDLKLSQQQMRGFGKIVCRVEFFGLAMFLVLSLQLGIISWKLLPFLALFVVGMMSGWCYETSQQHARDKKMDALKAINQLRQRHVSPGK